MQSNGLLKVCSILMIIGAAIDIILSVIALAGVGILAAAGIATGLVIVSTILLILACIIQMIAGVKGVKGANDPALGSKCVIWGVLVIILSVISNVLNIIAGNGFNTFSFLLGLVLPVLYIIGASKSKKMLAE